jgi:phosphate-selective porin OprO/OprP
MCAPPLRSAVAFAGRARRLRRRILTRWALVVLPLLAAGGVWAAEVVPLSAVSEERWAQLTQPLPQPDRPQTVLDPNQPGNIAAGAGGPMSGGSDTRGVVLDPNQAGNLDTRLNKKGGDELPLIKLSGFFQLDDGLYSQTAASRNYFGDIQDGISFRRVRLQALGKLTEFTGYTIEMDFAQAGRPSFADVWGEQSELPFLGTVRIGQFRMPGTMDSWTSVRHLNFLERSAPFQAEDPFRRVGIMAYAMSDDERTEWAYAVFGTGLTFWNGAETVYSTFGDNRGGMQIGDNGGVSFSSRITHLLWYDEPSDGRYLAHVGTGFLYSQVGGEGSKGEFAKTYRSLVLPEFFVGDPAGGGSTAAGTPRVLDSGRILTNDFSMYHAEFAFNRGSFNFQTEAMLEAVNQFGGPTMLMPAAYMQCGYFLTGEHAKYLKQAGVFDYNVVPFTPFFGTGRHGRVRGWGAWELAFRWSYVDMSFKNLDPQNQLSQAAGPPQVPSLGVLNESTVGVNWWWNRFTRVQFNWIRSMPNHLGYGLAPFDIYGTRFQIEF